MKRVISGLCAVVLLLCAVPMAVSAQTAAVYVTEASYRSITMSAEDGVFLYTAYEADGAYVLGTMNAHGELTREAYSPERWEVLFPDDDWAMTVHGDASAFCPYAHTHSDATICPYKQVLLVTMRHTQTNVTIENVYIQSTISPILPDGVIHFCLGRRAYTSPETLRYAAGERYMARRGDNGAWGVFDAQSGGMITPYRYADMQAVYGIYAKVYNGTAWGRLDLSGRMPLAFTYATAEAFSVREEARAVEGGYQVFSKDNEAISPLIVGDYTDAYYAAQAGVTVLTAADGTKTLMDLQGETVATFTASQRVTHLQGACFAVENTNSSGGITGVALLRVDGAPTAGDTVLKGDADDNGVVDTADARRILTALVGGAVLTDRQAAAADMDGDGILTTADARDVLRATISM